MNTYRVIAIAFPGMDISNLDMTFSAEDEKAAYYFVEQTLRQLGLGGKASWSLAQIA